MQIRGARYIKNDTAGDYEFDYQIEYIRINNKLMNINKEKDKFFTKLCFELKTFFKKIDHISLEKDKLLNKYKLNYLFEEINNNQEMLKNVELPLIEKEDETYTLATIFEFYNQIEECNYAALELLKIIQLNKKGQINCNQIYNSINKANILRWVSTLVFEPELVLNCIQNNEIKEYASHFVYSTFSSTKTDNKVKVLKNNK